MFTKNERLVPRVPEAKLCQKCRNALKPVNVAGSTIERHNYSTCDAYRLKPHDVLWDNADCEMFGAK